jgi:hypothetical protein
MEGNGMEMEMTADGMENLGLVSGRVIQISKWLFCTRDGRLPAFSGGNCGFPLICSWREGINDFLKHARSDDGRKGRGESPTKPQNQRRQAVAYIHMGARQASGPAIVKMGMEHK